jgi:diguanylate cyclase
LRLLLDLAHDLRDAVKNGELVVYYQPQFQARTGILCGFEALTRWQHPQRGLVPPDTFIPIAEEQGLIVELGDWVLREACVAATGWPAAISISVNLSPLQLADPGLVENVRGVLRDTGLEPGRLELEVTEGVLIGDFEGALDTLSRLRGLGISIAMDDFGAGFSSLSTLRAFPFDRIKIDKSFVRAIGPAAGPGADQSERSRVIVRGVLDICRGLDVPVVAEGVETEAQLEFLRAENCAVIQGFLLGRPAPLVDHAAVLRFAADAASAPGTCPDVGPDAAVRRAG